MGLAQMRLHPGTLTARHGHEAAVARLGSDQCERGHAARQGSSMGRRAAPVAPSSRLTMLSLFSLFLSTSMTPSRCSLLSHTLSPQIWRWSSKGRPPVWDQGRSALWHLHSLPLVASPPIPLYMLYESICGWVDMWRVEPFSFVLYESIYGWVDLWFMDELICDIWIVSWMNCLIERRWRPASMEVAGLTSMLRRAWWLYSFLKPITAGWNTACGSQRHHCGLPTAGGKVRQW